MGWVLVADDDDDIREMIELIVASEGMRAVGARDGVEALEQLRADGVPSVVLLDWMMPRLSGNEVLRAVRADPRLHDLPVVVLSGNPGSVEEAKRSGADGSLQKPVDLDELLHALHRFTG